MKLTISTFLFVTLQFVLARSSATTTFALPPVMTIFPILAYSLIISAFSYISARILKHFNFSSDLLAFLRRKGRFAPRSITHEHELLPTSTASPSATPLFGMYAASSNVTPRSSLDALPVLPPRLISPLSSPPGPSQSRRVTNPPLSSFSILKPTLYRHKHRRSRSLGVPTPRPRHWTSQFPPSPPVQQETTDSRRRNSEDDIPLAFLSRGAERPSCELRTLASAPVLHEPSMSAPILLIPDSGLQTSIHGPLVDISPVSPDSTSSSSRQASSITGLSYSGSELALQPSSSPSDSNSLSSLSRSTQSSDIGAQTIDRLGGFAYDWGFDNVNDINFIKSPPRTIALQESSSIPLPSDHEIIVASGEQSNNSHSGIGDQASGVAEGGVMQDAMESALVQVPTSVQLDLLPIDDGNDRWTAANLAHSSSDPSTAEEMEFVTYPPPLVSEVVDSKDIQPDNFQEIASKTSEDDRAMHEGETTPQKSGEDSWDETSVSTLSSLPHFTIENSHAEERPLIAVNTSDLINPPKRRDSARGGKCLSPLSPSQTPTPPASPLLTSMEVSKDLTGIRKSQLGVTMASLMSEPTSPIRTKEDAAMEKGPLTLSIADAEKLDEIRREDVQGENSDIAPAVVLQEGSGCGTDKAEGNVSPVSSHASPTCSPRIAPSVWSMHAADSQPLGMSTAQATLVQEEVAWPNANLNLIPENEGPQNEQADEVTSITTQQHVQPAVEDQETLPGTFPELESIAEKQSGNLSASSAAVVAASGISHQRRSMRGLPLDVALAMQLRPGLGVGADPAWMVRFLMAVFGWFAVMIAGRGGEVDVYAL